MRRGLWVAIAALVVVFLAVLLVFGSYVSAKNQMVTKREAVTASWGEVNNQLQRRADLIPNLVETVKGYAKQETTVFGDIANARAGLLNAHGDPKATIQANGAARWCAGTAAGVDRRIIPISSRTQTFSAFPTNWPARKTGSASRECATTRTFRTTTPLSGSFPTASGRGWAGSNGTTTTSRRVPARRTCLRSASKPVVPNKNDGAAGPQ